MICDIIVSVHTGIAPCEIHTIMIREINFQGSVFTDIDGTPLDMEHDDTETCMFFLYFAGGIVRRNDEVVFYQKHKVMRETLETPQENVRYVFPEGELGTEPGSSIFWKYGSVFFFKDNKLHRPDGPALVDHDFAYQEWRYNGVLHRENGPARIGPDEKLSYFNMGTEYFPNGCG